jgi:predicted DNA-binding transcriptional regulator AlpA
MTLPRPAPLIVPRGLARAEAAAYVGIGATKFDQLVADGRMPRPRRIDGRKVWDRAELDAAFDDLPRDGQGGPGDYDDDDDNEWLAGAA